LKDWKIGSGRQ